jgi:hypothetical protein
MLLSAIDTVLLGNEVSDFEESFPPVRQVIDLKDERDHLRAEHAALREEIARLNTSPVTAASVSTGDSLPQQIASTLGLMHSGPVVGDNGALLLTAERDALREELNSLRPGDDSRRSQAATDSSGQQPPSSSDELDRATFLERELAEARKEADDYHREFEKSKDDQDALREELEKENVQLQADVEMYRQTARHVTHYDILSAQVERAELDLRHVIERLNHVRLYVGGNTGSQETAEHALIVMMADRDALREERDAIIQAVRVGQPEGSPPITVEAAPVYIRGMWYELAEARAEIARLHELLAEAGWTKEPR